MLGNLLYLGEHTVYIHYTQLGGVCAILVYRVVYGVCYLCILSIGIYVYILYIYVYVS